MLRVGDVLDFGRGHPPARRSVEEYGERRGLDDCLVVRQRNIRPFHLAGALSWVSYEAVRRAFESGEGRSHNSPWARTTVFAPVRVVLAEHPRLRALLSYEPIYPWRGKVGTPRPGVPLWLAYAAVGVLNSSSGQRAYEAELAQLGLQSSESGVALSALERIPVARVGYHPQDLRDVAALVHGIGTLYEAQADCGRSFAPLIRDLRECLDVRLGVLAASPDEPSAPPGWSQLEVPFPTSDLLGRLPRLRAGLLSEADRADYQRLLREPRLASQDHGRLDQLRALAAWQDALDVGPPSSVTLDPVALAA